MMDKKPRGTRKGFTTGANAAAAARAAAVGLLCGKVPTEIESLLPNGTRITFAIHDGATKAGHAHAVCIKDAGDDPDCTHKAHLTADISILQGQAGTLTIGGGEGVGTITMRGLGIAIGSAAINPVPLQNIEANVREAATELLKNDGLAITISVPKGEEMAVLSEAFQSLVPPASFTPTPPPPFALRWCRALRLRPTKVRPPWYSPQADVQKSLSSVNFPCLLPPVSCRWVIF